MNTINKFFSFLVYPLEEDNNIEEDYEKFLQATAVRAAEKVYHFMRLLMAYWYGQHLFRLWKRFRSMTMMRTRYPL